MEGSLQGKSVPEIQKLNSPSEKKNKKKKLKEKKKPSPLYSLLFLSGKLLPSVDDFSSSALRRQPFLSLCFCVPGHGWIDRLEDGSLPDQ